MRLDLLAGMIKEKPLEASLEMSLLGSSFF